MDVLVRGLGDATTVQGGRQQLLSKETFVQELLALIHVSGHLAVRAYQLAHLTPIFFPDIAENRLRGRAL